MDMNFDVEEEFEAVFIDFVLLAEAQFPITYRQGSSTATLIEKAFDAEISEAYP
jgi:hypothetical protein